MARFVFSIFNNTESDAVATPLMPSEWVTSLTTPIPPHGYGVANIDIPDPREGDFTVALLKYSHTQGGIWHLIMTIPGLGGTPPGTIGGNSLPGAPARNIAIAPGSCPTEYPPDSIYYTVTFL
jgi:hypothetical protein